MHLANGAISPECAVLGFSAAAVGLGYGIYHSRNKHGGRVGSASPTAAKAAALGGLVFAAQMINVPLLANSSAHFVGGVLLAELLGTGLGPIVMSIVLLAQAVLLGDGGMASLGVNIVNMAILPAALLAGSRRLTPNRWHAIGAASAVSILLAVVLISGEVAVGRAAGDLVQWPAFVAALFTSHAVVCLLEAGLTVASVALWRHYESVIPRRAWTLPAATASMALILAAMAWGVSSSLPDGYESAAESVGWEVLLTDDANVISEVGAINAALHDVQATVVGGVAVVLPSEIALAVAATAVVTLFIAMAARLLRLTGVADALPRICTT